MAAESGSGGHRMKGKIEVKIEVEEEQEKKKPEPEQAKAPKRATSRNGLAHLIFFKYSRRQDGDEQRRREVVTSSSSSKDGVSFGIGCHLTCRLWCLGPFPPFGLRTMQNARPQPCISVQEPGAARPLTYNDGLLLQDGAANSQAPVFESSGPFSSIKNTRNGSAAAVHSAIRLVASPKLHGAFLLASDLKLRECATVPFWEDILNYYVADDGLAVNSQQPVDDTMKAVDVVVRYYEQATFHDIFLLVLECKRANKTRSGLQDLQDQLQPPCTLTVLTSKAAPLHQPTPG
ncbi:hypothetical protein DIZ76_011513 [Coccidioides immitis]|uniref:Uncharacterized protein n=1 Tax=Coccidioides immitis RMSCC 3703 TaxID=454286 RepID=A0A0J8QJZ4_COCIT|nr:hypothetical protein CISG_03189 [Coccidioides immitis RMSCC 3703]TPX26054.1 hypothetical protein DIZ76_011513 [Coccidioides immitis]